MAKVIGHVLEKHPPQSSRRPRRAELTLEAAQQQIFNFLLSIVREWPADEVLAAFREIFINHTDSTGSNVSAALYTLIFANNEQEFHNTLKRSCYILVNNWEVIRNYTAIQKLVELFQDPTLHRHTFSPTLKRLRAWILRFKDSEDYRELELFAARFSEEKKQYHWTSRYTSYLLVPQYMNMENPAEQREAARVASRRLKEKFKFDLAMYTAHAQSSLSHKRALKNPTALGDSALRLIKAIILKRGPFSYRNLAHLFLEQTKNLPYREFKKSLIEYLVYAVDEQELAKALKQQLTLKLAVLYEDYDETEVDRSLLMRTCNRTIDYLMTEDKKTPSSLFTLLLSQGSSLSLAVILLKIILISRSSHPYLEASIAALIRYYEQFPRDQCAWIINFLEVFQVTFTIHAENVEYNLIDPNAPQAAATSTQEALEACRIFSQLQETSQSNPSPIGASSEDTSPKEDDAD